jgi:hypothetical protein
MKKLKAIWKRLEQTLLLRILKKIVETVVMAISTVLLTVGYFLVVTPIGLIFKFRKIDLLKCKLDKNITSYWEAVPVDGPGSRPDKPY